MRISDWSSDVCSSDLETRAVAVERSFRRRGDVGADQPRHAVARQFLAHHAVAGAEVEHALAVEVVAALRQHLVEQLRTETRRLALEAFVEDLLVQPGTAVDVVVVVEPDVLAAAFFWVEEAIDLALRLAA